MNTKFDIAKIVNYLSKYKNDLPSLYKWNAKIEKLADLGILDREQIMDLDKLTPYEKELRLKKIVGKKLNDTEKTNKELFEKICLWVIKDWGGITSGNENNLRVLIHDFLDTKKPKFTRIASTSKVGAYMRPDRNIIYDSRVAYSLNWIILSENAGNRFFPIPEGRNSRMSAFDLNVLIRLKNISVYHRTDVKDLDNKQFISNCDKEIFINKNDAYFELNQLVREINKDLWKGDSEKVANLNATEMLLYSIADRLVFMDITAKYGVLAKE